MSEPGDRDVVLPAAASPSLPVCQVCGEALDGRREAVSCSRCGTPHHRDCWGFAGGCSTFACGSAHARGAPPGGVPPAASPGPVLRIDSLGTGSVGGELVRLPTTARPRTLVALRDDAALDTSSRYTRLDLDTPLEKLLRWGALAALAFSGLGLPGEGHAPDWRILGALWPLAGALMLLRMAVDCTYVLDNPGRRLLYARSILGGTQTWTVCRFDEVRRVVLSGEEKPKESGPPDWAYGVVLELPGALRVQVSADTRDYDMARGFAERLAGHLGAPLQPSQPRSRGSDPGDWFIPMRAAEQRHDLLPAGVGRAGVWDVLLFVVTVVLNGLAFWFR